MLTIIFHEEYCSNFFPLLSNKKTKSNKKYFRDYWAQICIPSNLNVILCEQQRVVRWFAFAGTL